MDEKQKEEFRKRNAAIDATGQKVGGGYPGRLPHTLPEAPVFDADPFGPKTKPIDPKCYPDWLNKNITQPKPEEDKKN